MPKPPKQKARSASHAPIGPISSAEEPQDALLQAIDAVQNGNPAAALELACRAVALDPSRAEAYGLLGQLHFLQGRYQDAIHHFDLALALAPDSPVLCNNLAVALIEQGLYAEAEAAARRAVELQPDYAEAFYNLGKALHLLERYLEAAAIYRSACELEPDNDTILLHLGASFLSMRQFAEAEECARKAIRLRSDSSDTHALLAKALIGLSRSEEAEAEAREALRLNPRDAQAYPTLGTALADQRRWQEAAEVFERAYRLFPGTSVEGGRERLLGAAAEAMMLAGRLAEASELIERLLAQQPDDSEALGVRALILQQAGQFDEAREDLRRALRLTPEAPEVHVNYAMFLLRQGEFEEGWREYEWRVRRPEHPMILSKTSSWDGSLALDQTLLVICEQGLGDTLPALRLLPWARRRVARIVFLCQKELVSIAERCEGVDEVIPVEFGSVQPILPEHELWISLMSLPGLMGLTAENIRAEAPYIRIGEEKREKWRKRLAGERSALNIGIVWAGNPRFVQDRARSTNLASLAPLAGIPGARFFSLQKGNRAEQAQRPPAGMELVTLGPELNDMEDTAAAMLNLDLVITTCTSPAHLAGALAVPTWTALNSCADWRWLLDREDTPWYPAMRLFRQPEPGDWRSVFERMAEELRRRPL